MGNRTGRPHEKIADFPRAVKWVKPAAMQEFCGMRHFLRSIFMLRVFCTTRWHPCWSVPDLNHVGLCDFRSWTVSLISALSASRPISLTMSSERCLASKWQHSCPIWICVSYEVTTPPTFAGLLLSDIVQLQDYEDSDTSSACWAIWVFP